MPNQEKIHCDLLEDPQFNQSTEKWEDVPVFILTRTVVSLQVEKLWELMMISKESLKNMVQDSYNHVRTLININIENPWTFKFQ